jgi:hypothetical protein
MCWLRISSGVKCLASPRKTGSQTLAILILISFLFSEKRGLAQLSGFIGSGIAILQHLYEKHAKHRGQTIRLAK